MVGRRFTKQFFVGACVLFVVGYSSHRGCSQNNDIYQPYIPTVVGGLPPGSKGLAQPVYVADRGSQPPSVETEEIELSTLIEFDESKVTSPIPSKPIDKRFEAAGVVAIVGSEYVLIGDLVDPKKATAEVVDTLRFQQSLRRALVECVTRKVLAQNYLNDMLTGKAMKDRNAAHKTLDMKINQMFQEKIIPEQMVKMNCNDLNELEAALEKMGVSYHALRREFKEVTLAQESIRSNVKEKPQIELTQLRDHYHDHLGDWQRPARARFRQLTAGYSKYKDKQAAYEAIVAMGNDVVLGGTSFAAVAKKSSTGFRADEGGYHDWTIKGALKSKILDEAIFSIQVGGLSQIIEDSDGFHIIEVVEREPEFTVPFVKAQSEITKSLSKEMVDKQRKEFITKIREKTPIWTRWPDDIPGSKPLSDVIPQ